MAHPAQQKYVESVKKRHPEHFTFAKVFEGGSLDVNGSFRDLFEEPEVYVGVDVTPGKGVDLVTPIHQYEAPNESFTVVCSGECFEHDEYWKESLHKMYNLLEKGGLFFFTCASTGRAEHGTMRTQGAGSLWGTSPDYYKNLSEDDIRSIWNVEEMFDDYEFIYNDREKDLYFKGIKK